MARRRTKKTERTDQSQKFIDKARELGVDESDDPLDRILKRIVKPKPNSGVTGKKKASKK